MERFRSPLVSTWIYQTEKPYQDTVRAVGVITIFQNLAVKAEAIQLQIRYTSFCKKASFEFHIHIHILHNYTLMKSGRVT